MRPSDLPGATVLAETKPHGTRIRYMAGCKCLLCRAANSRYGTMRAAEIKAGNWNGLVPADQARRHLLKLSRMGIGRRAVNAACDVSLTALQEIRSGRKQQIRALTERRILAVDAGAASDRSIIPARKTWKQISRLLSEGFTKTELAQRLGYARALQFNRKMVTAANAAKVDRLYRTVMAEAAD